MRTALKVTVCLALVIVGAGFFTWRKARDKAGLPVDLRLPASAQVFNTGDFSVTEDAEYLVAISAERTIPLDALGCLLGIDDRYYKCRDTPSAFNAAWELSANGKGIAHGSSSAERVSFWSDRVSRGIGRFAAKRGQRYRFGRAVSVRYFSVELHKAAHSSLLAPSSQLQRIWKQPALRISQPRRGRFCALGCHLVCLRGAEKHPKSPHSQIMFLHAASRAIPSSHAETKLLEVSGP